MKLVIAEKPLVAQSLAKVLGAKERHEGYLEGNGYLVSWCIGHLVELSPPEAYVKGIRNGDMKICRFCHRNGSTRCIREQRSNLMP